MGIKDGVLHRSNVDGEIKFQNHSLIPPMILEENVDESSEYE